jgi:hypothetical protein
VHDYSNDHRGDAATPAPCGRAQRAEAADQVSEELPRKLHPSAPQRGPLSLHRAQLVELNAQHRAAVEALRRSQEPPRRLHALIDGLQHAEQNLISLQNEHDGEVGSYVANGCKGNRPTPPRELVEAERALAQAAEDARVARHALPTHEAVVTEAAKLVGELTARREQALRDAVLEAIADHLDRRYSTPMEAARAAEKVAWDIADGLTETGDPQTAQRVAEAIRAAKSRLTTPKPEPQRGKAFLAALMRDPASAQLGE